MTEIHELVECYPELSAEEYAQLRDDIGRKGLLVPVIVWRGSIVDGRHRQRACAETGTQLRTEKLPDEWLLPQVAAYVWSANAQRRHMTASQKAMTIALQNKLVDKFQAEAASRKAAAASESNESRAKPGPGNVAGTGKPRKNPVPVSPKDAFRVKGPLDGRPPSRPLRKDAGDARNDIATVAGVSPRTMQAALTVVKEAPELASKVVRGDISAEQAARAAKTPPDKRAGVVAQLATPSRTEDAGDSWGTPPEYLGLARRVMGGIDLDPASNAHAQRTVAAAKFFTKDDDGLERDWEGRVWLNPPYSQPLVSRFAEKLVAEVKAKRAKQACVLVNNATDTKFGQLLLGACDAVLFPDKRVRFIAPGSDEPLAGTRQGQMLLYFGSRVKTFAAAAKVLGWVGVSA